MGRILMFAGGLVWTGAVLTYFFVARAVPARVTAAVTAWSGTALFAVGYGVSFIQNLLAARRKGHGPGEGSP